MSSVADRVLLLGGTTEASEFTRRLRAEQPEVDLVVSFAGRTTERGALPEGVLSRVGGFGGVDGLTEYLRAQGFCAVVDATHPFAARMPFHAGAAALATGTPLLRLIRPPWLPKPEDRWIDVTDMAAAAEAVARCGGRRVFLTIGRQEVGAFASIPSATFVVRAIEPPAIASTMAAEVILARGPFALDDELALLREHRIDLMVSKNSGGEATGAKIEAARQLGLPIVMVARPAAPDGTTVSSVDAALSWLAEVPARTVAR
ncbi:MAG: Precorrin-6x reductase [Acidimicrobiia bacterium]|nr:Precorrin-6x reductase [Acidimicrobiia bacterium]